jgi:hypothetical protein
MLSEQTKLKSAFEYRSAIMARASLTANSCLSLDDCPAKARDHKGKSHLFIET